MAKKKFDCKIVGRWDIILGEDETHTVLGTEAQAWSHGKVRAGEVSFKVRPSFHRGEVDSRNVLSSFFPPRWISQMKTIVSPPITPLLDFDLDIPKSTFKEEDRIVWVVRKDNPIIGEAIPTLTWSAIRVRLGDVKEGEKHYTEYDPAWEATFEMSLIDEILVE